jgi:hypothetical protein
VIYQAARNEVGQYLQKKGIVIQGDPSDHHQTIDR